jgi:hypothetical protein
MQLHGARLACMMLAPTPTPHTATHRLAPSPPPSTTHTHTHAQECFPYVARRLLADDDDPRIRQALRDLLYGGKARLDVDRCALCVHACVVGRVCVRGVGCGRLQCRLGVPAHAGSARA